MSRLVTLVCALLAALTLIGCATTPAAMPAATPAAPAPATEPVATVGAVTISDPWVRSVNPMAPAATATTDSHSQGSSDMGMGSMDATMVNTAGYMVLRNTGSSPDYLVAARADFSEAVELHTMVMQDNVMKMNMVERIEIPAGGEVALAPGGFHVMFLGVNQELAAGTTAKVTLVLEQGGEITLDMPVRMP